MVKKNQTFGQRVREMRMQKQITLRKFAEMIGVSATYVSQIERDEFKPPSEDKIRQIADLLGEDKDEMLALADKVSSDLPLIIQKHPQQVATFLRTAQGFKPEQWEKLTNEVAAQFKKKEDKDK